MNKLEKLETIMSNIPCPNCFSSRFQINLNCEFPKAPHNFLAVCNHCNYKFFFTDDPKVMEEMWVIVEDHMLEKGCPECGAHNIYLEYLCDVLSEGCFFLVRCQDNNHYNRLSLRGMEFLFH